MLSLEEYNKTKAYLENLLGHPISDKRIKAIGVNPLYHGQPKQLIQVDQFYSDLEPNAPREQVIAIFETKLFCVCTPQRGGGQGMPYFFTRQAVYEVIEID